MRARSWFVVLAVGAVVAGSLAAAVPAAVAAPGPATGGPGALSHFDLARKDCLGTARNTTSKIWYTVAGGVLSDVYAPTIDTTNVETMQYLVTDGSSFTDLQTRDTTYTVSADSTGMVCTVTSTAKTGAYRLTTTYLTDPARPSVVVQTSYTPLTSAAASYRVYVRLDATVGGNGGGGSGNGGADNAVIDTTTGSPVPVSYDTNTKTNAANRDYAVPSFLALRADQPFGVVSSGFVGTPSDGLAQLDSAHMPDADRFRSRRQCGADGAGALRQARRRDARPRFRHHAGRRRRHRQRHGRPALRVAARPIPVGVAFIRRRAQYPIWKSPRPHAGPAGGRGE